MTTVLAAALLDRGHEVPVATWLVILADVALCAGGLCAAILAWDIVRNRRQMMAVMRWVWPINALWLGPLALWAYWTMQVQPMRRAMQQMQRREGPGAMRAQADSEASEDDHQGGGMMERMVQEKPFWQQVFTGALHCGSGCTLGDIIGEFAIFGLGATILGVALYPEYVADYLLAYALGIAFQYFSIAPMRGVRGAAGIWQAIKADTLSLTAFEIGLFGWMALSELVLFDKGIHPNSPVHWFMMQIGMALGFLTSYPVNWLLLRRRIKEPM